MAPPNILSLFRQTEYSFIPLLPTGSIMDVVTGCYLPGMDGSHILNGGISPMHSNQGRPQTYKSTDIVHKFVNAWIRIPGSDLIIYDSETTLNMNRILLMADFPVPQNNLFELHSKATMSPDDFLDRLVIMGEHKRKHKKDYLVETPFIDPKTGKNILMLLPTFVLIDSFSNMQFSQMTDMLVPDAKLVDGEVDSKESISDSKKNTVYMKDGLSKKKFLNVTSDLAVTSGMYFGMVAHIGNKINMENQHGPTPKIMQHMKQVDSPKGVTNDFLFLNQNLFNCNPAEALYDANKESQYPSARNMTGSIDYNLIKQTVVKCKNNASGGSIAQVASQTFGVDNGLTYYHYLKTAKRGGLKGNDQNHAISLVPDKNLRRTTVNDILNLEPKMYRAIEIVGQLVYIQLNWTMRDLPVPFDIHPDKLYEELLKSNYAIDDILATRGWWTYDKTHPQYYMSLFDILAIISGKYTPAKFPTKTSPAVSKIQKAA